LGEAKLKMLDNEFKAYDWEGSGRLSKEEAKNCVLHFACYSPDGENWEELVIFAFN
jgi:hypothetical protein